MRHRPTSRRVIGLAAILTLILAACGTESSGTTATTGQTTTTTTLLEPTGHVVYFMLDELEAEDGGPFLVPVYREMPGTNDPALTAMQLLLEGPTPNETAGTPSVSTAIPEGTAVLGVAVDDGLATVDLSEAYDDGGGSFSMFARLGQVVYTLTRLPDVDRVDFKVDGEPVTVFSSEGIELDGPQQRDGYYDLLPAIFVDAPSWGEPLTSPIRVQGLSNVFEAVSQVMLTDDDGLPLFEGMVMATCGSGCWGEWETAIPYTVDRGQFGALIVWEDSAEDGSRIHIREYPILIR